LKTQSLKKAVNCFLIIVLSVHCADIFSQTIPIRLERNKTILPVTIEGVGSLNILFDSVLSFDGLMIYNPDLKDSIILKKEIQVRIPGVGGGEPSIALMDDSATFFVGDVEFKNQKVLVLQNDSYKGFPSDGIIGYSILGHYATEIDYDKNMMRLYDSKKISPDGSWQRIPMYFKNNTIPWIDIFLTAGWFDGSSLGTWIQR